MVHPPEEHAMEAIRCDASESENRSSLFPCGSLFHAGIVPSWSRCNQLLRGIN
jgi:hypothetical protein